VARSIARRHTSSYLRLPNYRHNLERMGFAQDELDAGGNDRMVDAVVAWGDVGRVAARIREHLQAGADHVAIQVITADPAQLPVEQWSALARELGAGSQ